MIYVQTQILFSIAKTLIDKNMDTVQKGNTYKGEMVSCDAWKSVQRASNMRIDKSRMLHILID